MLLMVVVAAAVKNPRLRKKCEKLITKHFHFAARSEKGVFRAKPQTMVEIFNLASSVIKYKFNYLLWILMENE